MTAEVKEETGPGVDALEEKKNKTEQDEEKDGDGTYEGAEVVEEAGPGVEALEQGDERFGLEHVRVTLGRLDHQVNVDLQVELEQVPALRITINKEKKRKKKEKINFERP